jgi:hypothetical protein
MQDINTMDKFKNKTYLFSFSHANNLSFYKSIMANSFYIKNNTSMCLRRKKTKSSMEFLFYFKFNFASHVNSI